MRSRGGWRVGYGLAVVVLVQQVWELVVFKAVLWKERKWLEVGVGIALGISLSARMRV